MSIVLSKCGTLEYLCINSFILSYNGKYILDTIEHIVVKILLALECVLCCYDFRMENPSSGHFVKSFFFPFLPLVQLSVHACLVSMIAQK